MFITWHRTSVAYLCHDHILAFLHILPFSFDDGVQEVEVLHMASMSGQAVHEVLEDILTDLWAKLVVIIEDMLHCFCFHYLKKKHNFIIIGSLICNIAMW